MKGKSDGQEKAKDVQAPRQPADHAAATPAQMKCEHYACRCARAAELAAIADRTGDARYLAEAIAVHHAKVTCRNDPCPDESPGARAVGGR